MSVNGLGLYNSESEISGSCAISPIRVVDMFSQNVVVMSVTCLHHLSIRLNISSTLLKNHK